MVLTTLFIFPCCMTELMTQVREVKTLPFNPEHWMKGYDAAARSMLRCHA